MWEAIGNLAWPALAAIVVFKLWPRIDEILKKDGTVIKVGGIELSIPEATKSIGKDVSDIQERLSILESQVNFSKVKSLQTLQPTPESTSIRCLLWVDDFPSNNAFIIERLKDRGIDVELSLNTKDALRKIDICNFPAIITDLGRIEDGNENIFAGLDLIKDIRKRGIKTPILVFAGQRGIKHRSMLISAGAEDVTSSGVDVLSFIEKHFGI